MANKKENPNRHEFTITKEGETWTKLVNDAFNEVKKDKTVDGFRKGKVTKEVYDKKFGKESYLIEAANKVVSEEFIRIMQENHYELVADPQIHITTLTEEKIEFTMALIETPIVNVKKYKGLGIKKDKVEVTDEQINEEIKKILEDYAELVVKGTDTVENGDFAIIDYEGFVDGVAFDGGKDENHTLEIGSGAFIPGFEEQIIGMKKDEEKDIIVTFPEEYHSDELSGKEATFKVKVNEIKVREERKLDEEFFEDLGLDGVDSEESLKELIKKDMTEHLEMHAENKYVDDLIEAVTKQTEVDIPEEMVFDTTERMFEDLKKRLSMQGINFEIYSQITGKTEEEIKNEMEKVAFSRVLARLTLEEIKTKENITVTDEEVDAKIKEISEHNNISEEEVLKRFGNKEMLKYDLEMNKVIDFLKEANK